MQVGRVNSQGRSAGGRFRLVLQVTRSHLVAVCAIEKPTPSISEISDIVRNAAAFPVDYLAFLNRGAYEVVLDLCLNNETSEAWAIPVTEPFFAGSADGLSFDPKMDTSHVEVPWAAGAVPEFPTALHDLTEAIRYPRRTFEYCRMAVEVVRRHFDPQSAKRDASRHVRGEQALCAALRVTRGSLRSLERVAARSRHGELVFSMNWEMRQRALELAWEIVARFGAFLQGAPTEGWRELDILVEQ